MDAPMVAKTRCLTAAPDVSFGNLSRTRCAQLCSGHRLNQHPFTSGLLALGVRLRTGTPPVPTSGGIGRTPFEGLVHCETGGLGSHQGKPQFAAHSRNAY